uniref:Cubilin n=1 Tax=Ditylenchus dipsaci TaxID=166011 RepID=A0A915DCG2_9BILA
MKTDECVEMAPCKNGATCVDLFSKYQCLCPDHYEGTNCDQRLDECEMYKGTPAGCQNNATCTNSPTTAGFTCHCPKGFHGHLCQQQKSSCDYSLDLCGEHGHCIPTETSYKCLCEWGFKVSGDPDNPVCTDIDECTDNPCYPGATCLNLPGTFKCSSCPKGLMDFIIGFRDGVHCHDFDECANDLTNDCSKSPKVDCINTFGSYKCGSCPQDYQGDGFKCEKISRCSSDRNPCAPNARCVDEGDELRCECPENTAGDGLGPEGCLPSNQTVCHADTCLNGGTCFATSDHTYKCSCLYGYLGPHCERPTHCLTKDYCNGRGKCVLAEGSTFCECDRGFFGPRCQFEEEACVLRKRSCLWYIQLLDSRKVLEISFGNFTIPKLYEVTSKGCESSFGNLTIFDGPDTDSPAIAIFVMETPFHIHSTHHPICWRAVQTRCGGRMTGNEGTVSYYDIHDEDNCMWFVSVPPQYHIELTIESLKMASKEFFNCSINSLEIYDNQVASNRTRISQLCETQPEPVVIRTSGNFAVVYFRLDLDLLIKAVVASERDKFCRHCKIGFSLSYKVIELPNGCGGEIRPDENGVFEGFIQSPNYGQAYFANLDCLWVLDASAVSNNTVTEESTESTELENGPKYSNSLMWRSLTLTNCRGDYVQIPELNYVFCNLQKPPSSMIVAPAMSIRFHTDSTVSGKGFMVKYQSVCYNEFTAENGTISSSNYPHASTRPFKCTYVITAKPHQAIRIVFNHIGLHTDVATCFYRKDKHKEMQDYIEFSGGYESNEAINKRYVCERYPFVSPGGEIVTSGNRPFKITYSTSGSRENTGFLFEYQLMDVGCGVFNGALVKKITSPNYPHNYLSHMYCVYYLSVPSGYGLRLSFDSFDVENVANRDDCDFDSVRVFDWFVDENSHGEQLGKFCGMNLPPPLLSTAGKMAVVFISDRSVSGTGFSASIQKVDLSADCDRTFTAPSGDITFNPSMFSQVTKCDYHIVLPSNHRIMLKFENFSAPCEYSTLTVKNGGSELSPGFPGLFRDSEVCDAHQFQSTNTRNSFFKVHYEQFESTCGGYIRGFTGSISAPQYPHQDSRTLSCEWHISASYGNKIRLQFISIDELDSDDGFGMCSPFARNYIDIGDGPTIEENRLKRYCKKELTPMPIDSMYTNELTVQYTQHGGSHHGALFGFLAHFSTVCNGVLLQGHHGTLQSPGFPERVLQSRSCRWTILTSPGSRIRLLFHQFRVTDSYSNGRETDALSVGPHRRCNNNFLAIGPDQLGELKMTVEENEPENHFWLSWITVGCGGSISKNNSFMVVNASSDFTDENASDVRKCSWEIKAPIGYIITVWIEQMTVAESSDSFSEPEGIEFYEGLSNQSSIPQKKFNSPQKNTSFVIFSNELFVVFTSHANSSERMFNKDAKDGLLILKANVTFTPNPNPSGGAVIKVDKNPIFIHSPNFPKAYPRGATSVWQFEAAEGYVVAFELLKYTTIRTVHSRISGLDDRPYETNNNTIECSANMAYLKGALSFFNGAYQDDLNSITNMRLFKRVCSDVKAPVKFTSATNVSVVSFRGAPYDPLVASGDNGALTLNSPSSSSTANSASEPAPIGFQMKVSTECGGRLYASHERKSLHITTVRFQTQYIGDHVLRGVEVNNNNNDAETIYLRIEKIRKQRVDEGSSNFEVYCNDELKSRVSSGQFPMFSSHFLEYTCDSTMRLQMDSILSKNPTECEWSIENIAGSRVVINIVKLRLPPSDFCAESYLEMREFNSTGPLIGRFCGTFPPKIERQSVWMRLRHTPAKPSSDEVDQELQTATSEQTYGLSIRYFKEYGGDTTSSVIESPPTQSYGRTNWHITAKNPENYLRIEFSDFYYNYDDATVIRIYDILCSSPLERSSTYPRCLVFTNNPINLKGSDIMENRVFTIRSNVATIVYDRVGRFKLHWQEIAPAEVNRTASSSAQSTRLESEGGEFSCGNELIPKFEPQTLISPTNALGRYNNNERCKWTIRRPRFTGIVLNLTKIDLEEHINCRYDFLTVTTKNFATQRELNEIPEWMRVCNRVQRGSRMAFSYDSEAFVYFSSDRSRAFRGFSIEYYLSCNTFEYIPAEQGALETVLTSPDYPTARRKMTPVWGIMLESYRDILVESLDMDLGERNAETGKCDTDSVQFYDRPYIAHGSTNNTFCGQEKVNVTMKNGRVFIKYKSSEAHADKKGFKFRVKEIMHDCSTSNLAVDEFLPQKSISSPEFPHLSPNSLNCQWTLSSPPGRRLKLTIDPITFNLQTSDNCDDDYLEIYDGASIHFPLIGKYCSADPPSTIFSSGSHLHLHYVTDSDIQSLGWNATFELGSLVLRLDVNGSITSPNFPDLYPSKTQCEWTVRAPSGHFVESFIDHLWLTSASNCSLDSLAIRDGNATGEYLLPPACFQAAVNSAGYRSSHNSAYVNFVSNNTNGKTSRMFCLNRKCGFEMHFASTKFSCGGTITDNEGIVYPPGYPDRIIPHVVCQWDFRAGINSRYVLELQFPDSNHEFYEKSLSYLADNAEYCFLDLEPAIQAFHVKYTKVDKDYDQNGCTYEITEPTTIQISDLNLDYGKVITGEIRSPESRGSKCIDCICHIQVRKPSSEHTTRLEFTDFRAGRKEARVCGSGGNQVRLLDELADPFQSTLLLDVYVLNNPYSFFDGTVTFNLTVTFYECGGLLNFDSLEGEMSGEITSPGFGTGNYTDNQECLWLLQAPEGSVISLSIVTLDLEYHIECSNDFLEISEGEDRSSEIQNIRSRGRTLTILFKSDATVTRKGFRLTYEFVGYETAACGFHTNALNGTFHSPNFPLDYGADEECIWDINVPLGYHIRLIFDFFDVVKSVSCEKDFLLVSQEHQPFATTLCGHEIPVPIDSESNRVRINFTSDSSVFGKGFKIRWEAVCGTVFKMNHGIITSPHYPHFYPNDNVECNYLIDPEANTIQIVTLKVLDFDLDSTNVIPRKGCNSDYLEIRDVLRGVTVMTLCGAEYRETTSSPISIKGPIGVKFVSNTSMIHDTVRGRKNHRGFKLSFALADCGGEINLADARNRMSAVITSPGFPLPYHHSLDCLWNISAPDDKIISYKFTDLDLEMSNECIFDYLEVFDGMEMSNETRVSKLCGKFAPEGQQKTAGNHLLIRLVTDHSSSKDGFRMVLTATLGPTQGCGGHLVANNQWQTLTPPRGEEHKYFADLRCEWNIRAEDPDSIIKIVFKELEMEEKKDSEPDDALVNNCYDFVAIYDGPKATSPYLLPPSCAVPEGRELPLTYFSSYRSLDVYFESDSYDEYRGFSFEYIADKAACGGKYLAGEQWDQLSYDSERSLTRANQRHNRCRFFFYSNLAQPIEILFTEFSFPASSQDCAEEYLEIRDVGSVAECNHPACATNQKNAVNTVRTCGKVAPAMFVSTTSVVQITTSVIFQSQYSSSFKLKYQLLSPCNRTITIEKGSSLESGRPIDRALFLVFGDFRLERGRYRPPFLRSFDRSWMYGTDASLRGIHQRTAGGSDAGPFNNEDRVAVSPTDSEVPTNCIYDSLSIYFNNSNPKTPHCVGSTVQPAYFPRQ